MRRPSHAIAAARHRVICEIDGADVSDRCLEASEDEAAACWKRRP